MQAISIGTLKLKDINGDTRSITIYDDFRKFPDYTEGEDDYIAIYHKSQKIGYLFSSREVYTNTAGEPTKCIFAEFIDKKGHKQYLYETQFALKAYPIASFSRTTSNQILIDEEDFEDLPYGSILYVTGSRGVNGNSGGWGGSGTAATQTYSNGKYYVTYGSNGYNGGGGAGGRNGYSCVTKLKLEREYNDEFHTDSFNLASGYGYGAGGGGGGGGGRGGYAQTTESSYSQTLWDPEGGGAPGGGGAANSLPREIVFNIPKNTKITLESITVTTSGSGYSGSSGSTNAGGSGGTAADGHGGSGRNGKNGGAGGTSSNLGQHSVSALNPINTPLYSFYEVRNGDNLANLLNASSSGTGGVQLNGLEYVPYSK